MDTIDLKRIFHRGKECVGLYFDNNPTLNNLVQKLTGVKWSQTNKCWYIPWEPEIAAIINGIKNKKHKAMLMLGRLYKNCLGIMI